MRRLELALFTLCELERRGSLVNWKMSQISRLTSSPPPPPPGPDNRFYLLKYVFVFLCVTSGVCVEAFGELLEHYHRVGGGRWSVSERAVRTCCPVRLDSHP